MYTDESWPTQVLLVGNMVGNDGDLYIGAYPHKHWSVPGAGFDNIQIFNKALTIDEIAILALANKDVMVN